MTETEIEERIEAGLGFSADMASAFSVTNTWTENTCNSCSTNCCSTFDCQATIDSSCPTQASTCVGVSC